VFGYEDLVEYNLYICNRVFYGDFIFFSVPAVSAAGVQKTSRDSSSLAKKTYDSGEITNSVVLGKYKYIPIVT